MHEQLYQTARDVGLDNSLDLIIRTVGKVGDGPASVNENLVVEGVHELGEDREGRSDGVPVGLRGLATTEVAECPGGVPEHAKLPAVTEEADKRRESALGEDVVPAVRAVTSNVTKSPDGLLPNIGLRAAKQLNEDGHGTSLNNDLGLLC